MTDFTLWGILNHSKLYNTSCDKELSNNKCSLGQSYNDCDGSRVKFSLKFYECYKRRINESAWSIEALIVRQADEIAQRHHDIEDALEANIIDKKYLVDKIDECFGDWFKGTKWNIDFENIKGENEKNYYLPMISRLIVDFLTTKLQENISNVLTKLEKDYNITSTSDFYKNKDIIRKKLELDYKSIFEVFSYEDSIKSADVKFQNFIGNIILNSHIAQSMDGKSNYIIRQLIKAYATNPQQLPDKTIITLYKSYLPSSEWNGYESKATKAQVGELRDRLKEDHFKKMNEGYKKALLRTICDYIAGMTDNYALSQFHLLYGIKL